MTTHDPCPRGPGLGWGEGDGAVIFVIIMFSLMQFVKSAEDDITLLSQAFTIKMLGI